MKWSDGKTYISIADDYAEFAVKHYGKATVVFDGYGGGPSLKDNTHLRRSKTHASYKVHISDTTKFAGKMEDFLSNKENKQTLIHLIANQLKKRKCDVIHAEGDADLDTVKTTISASSEKLPH